MRSKLETVLYVKDFLLRQNRKSQFDPLEVCRYRGPEGTKCAIGCLIPDEKYDPSFEGAGFLCSSSRCDLMLDIIREAGYDLDFALAQKMQRIHDAQGVTAWASEFDILADDYRCECKVCGNKCHDGSITHGKGCYHLSENGGGSSECEHAV